ncbi:GNAT family N-acetyltransferase [Lentzea sp. HUAS12]|uniref:GNAT family N-acetyltransferase n=1 Tax=Lentzea sp. HUAS12 TaxID=2951806 RepID=UPI00209D805B|nr:GNAT family N-acetyltransferase [Lentzea sp. HUAS12]USX48637.1 GNAT family N-acetyltransferase [Lentzea sp. HUAS12]
MRLFGYEVVRGGGEVLTRATDVEGLSGDVVTLIGCDTPYRLLPCDSGVALRVLDRDGRVLDLAGIVLDVVSVVPSAAGEDLSDVVLDQSRRDEVPVLGHRPPPAAREVWRLWREGVPAERNLWAPLGSEGRRWWNEVALRTPHVHPSAGVHVVDGTYATDEHGLHLALCEALVGPGHSLGEAYSITPVRENWWFLPGIELVWQAAEVAYEAVPDHFLGLLKYLRRNGVAVKLSTAELERRLELCVELGVLVDRWVAGWSRAESLEPHPLLDNWHVWADLPGRREERILAGDANVVAHAEDVRLSFVPTRLTVPTTVPDEVTRVAEKAGLVVHDRQTFLRRGLFDHPKPRPPEGCSVRVTPGEVIEVVASLGGEDVASGLIAVVGEDAVPHRLRTKPGHRGRGLGSLVMNVLVEEAVRAGAQEGLVFANADGLRLCRKLGWYRISDVVIASNGEGEA